MHSPLGLATRAGRRVAPPERVEDRPRVHDAFARLDRRRERPLGERHVGRREVLQQKVETPRRVFRIVAARQWAARHERCRPGVEGHLALADYRLEAGIEPIARGLQEQAGRDLAGSVGRVLHVQGYDRGHEHRAALFGVNRRDAPERKGATRPQALGELIGEEIVGPSDHHRRRKYSACFPWPSTACSSTTRNCVCSLRDGAAWRGRPKGSRRRLTRCSPPTARSRRNDLAGYV